MTTGTNLNLRGESTKVRTTENTPLTVMLVEFEAAVDVAAADDDDDDLVAPLSVDVVVGEGSPY